MSMSWEAARHQASASSQFLRIPDKILSNIFLDVKYLKNASQSCGPESWMVVCGVCACWRTVALNTPRLWADIYLERVKLATVMLERSGDAPLHIYCDLELDTDSEFSPFWSLAQKVLSPTYEHRIETLRLSCTDLSTLEDLLELAVSNMSSPRFHTLTIEGPCNFDLNSLTSLPFWNCLPRLRMLDLEYTSALSQMSTLASLTHFTCVSSTPTRTTVSWLLATLSNMPQVQRVTARFISNGPADVVPSSSPPIKLPFLQHLRLFFMTPSATRFFQYVDIPPTASIDISFFVDDMPALVSDVEMVFSQFAASINGSSIAPSETFKFSLDTDHQEKPILA
ncbi:hypothetical protein ONZ45_g7615 [Pleurotus djamor]|nr:hypothetical protein ONZ45_g7615 [Pleurotus djamor]